MLGRLAVLLILLFSFAALAQDVPPAPPPAPEPAADAPEKPRIEWTRTIYVPFRKLKSVFEKEGDGVYVPRKEFEALWKKAMDRPAGPTKPSSPYLITRAFYTGRVDGELAVITAVIEVETFVDGWAEVPLGLTGVALGEARLDDGPATMSLVKGVHRVLIPAAGAHRLTLEFVTAIREVKEGRSVSFGCPAVPVARLDFTVPGEGVKVTVEPNLATTRTDGENRTTRVLAYVGGAGKVSLRWKPKPVDLVAGPPLLLARTSLAVTYGEGVLRTDAKVDYRILRAPVDTFVLGIPDGVRVLFVSGKDLRDWTVEGEGAARRLTVSLHTPARDAYALAVTLETPAEDLAEPIPVPEIVERGVLRAQGIVVVRGPQDIQIRAGETSGVFRLNLARLPRDLAAANNVLAFRFPAHPWTVPLNVERILPRVTVVERTVVALTERKRRVRSLFDLAITRAGIFKVVFVIPADVEIMEVGPGSLVEDHRIEGDGETRRMIVDLKGRTEGTHRIAIVAEADFALGADEDVEAALPLVTPLDVDRFTGTVGITADEAFELKTSALEGLDPLDPAVALARLTGAAPRAGGAGLVMAFKHQTAKRSAVLNVRRKRPEVSAESITRVTVEENRALLETDLTYAVRYAGVDTYRFTLPAHLPEDDVVITAAGLKEKTSRLVDDEMRREWTVTTQSKVKGALAIRIKSHLAFEALEAGGVVTVVVPDLRVLDVVRERHWYAVTKDPVLEIESVVDRVEIVDPRELPAAARKQGAFLAFRTLLEPHRLSLSITRHDYVPLLDTVINHLHIETKISREGVAIHTASLALRSSGRQYLEVVMPAGAKIQEVSVDGRKERPRTDGDGAGTLIPLGGRGGGEKASLVRIVYRQDDLEMGGLFTTEFGLVAPRFDGDDGAPVSGTSWTVWLPTGVFPAATGGNMTRRRPYESWVRWALRTYLPRVEPGARPETVDVLEVAPDGVTRSGPSLRFARAQGGAEIVVSYGSPMLFAFLQILFLLGATALALLVPRRRRGHRGTLCLGLVVVPLIFLAFCGPGLARVFNAVLAGGIIAGAVWIGTGAVGTFRAWSVSRPTPTPVVIEEVVEETEEVDPDAEKKDGEDS